MHATCEARERVSPSLRPPHTHTHIHKHTHTHTHTHTLTHTHTIHTHTHTQYTLITTILLLFLLLFLHLLLLIPTPSLPPQVRQPPPAPPAVPLPLCPCFQRSRESELILRSWKSWLRQYLCFCTSSCVSICTFVLANLEQNALYSLLPQRDTPLVHSRTQARTAAGCRVWCAWGRARLPGVREAE